MRVYLYILLIALLPFNSYAQAKKGYEPSNQGTRNYAAGLNSFEYGIIGSNQDATGSPVGLVASIVRKVPSARKISDRYGNPSIALRGRNSVQAAGDEVLWDIDGIRYSNPPVLNINQVKYVEVLKGLAATNKYGSEGAGGVIVVKTNVNPDQISSGKNILRPKKAKPKKKKKKKKK